MAFRDFFAHTQSVVYTFFGLACLATALATYIVHSTAVFMGLSHLISFTFFVFLAPMAVYFLAVGIHSYIRESLADLQQCRRAQAMYQVQQLVQEQGQPLEGREGKMMDQMGIPEIAEIAEYADMTGIAVETTAPMKGVEGPNPVYKQIKPATIVPESVCKAKVCIGLCLDGMASLAFLAFQIVLWVKHLNEVMSCGVVFCVGTKISSKRASGTQQNRALAAHALMFGYFFLPISVGFAIHMIREAIVFNRILNTPTSALAIDGVHETKHNNNKRTFHDLYKPYKHISDKRKIFYMVLTIFLICVCAVSTFYMPNHFWRLTASSIASNAASRISTNYNRGTNLAVPEMRGAVFHTTAYRVSDTIYLKFYPGNLFFYCYLILIVILGYVLRWTRTGRSWFHRRLYRFSKWTVGEFALTVLTALLTALFSVYWIHDHNYKGAWSSTTNTTRIKWGEWWGRAVGQIAVLFLSLLLFPISRSSLLHDCLGSTWEHFLKFHRWCGYLMLLATALHTAFFYVSFHQMGRLKYNFIHYPTLVSYKNIRNDYFIVPISVVTYLMFISMGIFSFHKLRRRFYDLFYYTHIIIAVTIIPLTILHAAAAWMYILPGMTLWMADLFVRMWQRGAQVELVSARLVGDDVVEVRFRFPRTARRATIYAGQYVYVSFPQLSVLEWHPMTLAPPPPLAEDDEARDVYALYIKSMGTGTWTEKLREAVMKEGWLTSIGIDGPYGHGVDMADYDEVYMFAGGIGITPCATLFASLLHTAKEGKRHPEYVHLTWSGRSAALVGALSEAMMLSPALRSLNHAAAEPLPADQISNEFNDDDDVLEGETEIPEGNLVPALAKASVPCVGEVDGMAPLEENAPPQREDDSVPQGFECHVYLTKAEEYAAAQQAMAAGAGVSTDVAMVKTVVHEGRPSVPTQMVPYLTAARDTANRNKKRPYRLFFACGPKKLIHEVCKAAADAGAEVHVEEFEF